MSSRSTKFVRLEIFILVKFCGPKKLKFWALVISVVNLQPWTVNGIHFHRFVCQGVSSWRELQAVKLDMQWVLTTCYPHQHQQQRLQTCGLGFNIMSLLQSVPNRLGTVLPCCRFTLLSLPYSIYMMTDEVEVSKIP